MRNLSVYWDGSCGPKNPGGTAAYGFLVKDEDGVTIAAKSGRLGSGMDFTSNVAEYEGLYQSMLYVIEHYPDAKVVFNGDSTFVISQMRGESQARKGKYLPYYQKSIELAEPYQRNGMWTFNWISRSFNSEADDLAQYERY